MRVGLIQGLVSNMDILTFIVEIFKAAAWPLAAITIAVLFRTELQSLLNRIKHGKVGYAEIEFEHGVRTLETSVKSAPDIGQAQAPTALAVALATTDPRTAIIQAWLEVEDAITNLAFSRSQSSDEVPSHTLGAIQQLARLGALSSEQISLIYELRSLRNQAVHDLEFNPSTESVLGFAKLAREVLGFIKEAADRG